ncbi:MAG: NAD(P)/FAD-dependent oxidoreductase [Proteobacteria bacterium]|nr:NAD(P)/FAD-dependent oxidoreductase [Pseudomonadota bacterium]
MPATPSNPDGPTDPTAAPTTAPTTALAADRSFDILIIGGGAAGITTAALLRGKTKCTIAIVDPATTHSYQPGWTLVGAGIFTLEQTTRAEATLIPNGVEWIKQAAATFEPDHNTVVLADGTRLAYRYLIACPGLQLDWGKIEGLTETLGRNGVCSNYRGDLAAYTWQCIRNFEGGRMIFTQPPMPIKCPGAPQKIAYLAADHLRRTNKRAGAEIEFCTALDALFGVGYFIPALKAAMQDHAIAVNYKTTLKAIDGPAKKAIFAVTAPDGTITEAIRAFDMIHVTPPQSAPDVLKTSPIANAAGFVEVDQATMQHVKFSNIFALGDAASTPNSKTAAAVRMQAPVLVRNLIAAMNAQTLTAAYDGYGSCPLTTAYGKIVLAEFTYGGKVTPSFPLDPRKPRYSGWLLKSKFLPFLYWNMMLKGNEFDIGHKERSFADAA